MECSFYVVDGSSQTLITSTGGGYTSGTISAPGDGPLPGIQANLVVTGPVVSGYSLSGLPTVSVDLHADGRLRLEYGNHQHDLQQVRAIAQSFQSPAL